MTEIQFNTVVLLLSALCGIIAFSATIIGYFLAKTLNKLETVTENNSNDIVNLRVQMKGVETILNIESHESR